MEVPAKHGPVATESWVEEVCEIHAEPGKGKAAALACAKALDELARDEKVYGTQESSKEENKPGRCTSPSDDECTTL